MKNPKKLAHRCPACTGIHWGDYQLCENCQKSKRKVPDATHHPDCPAYAHKKADCICGYILGSHYA